MQRVAQRFPDAVAVPPARVVAEEIAFEQRQARLEAPALVEEAQQNILELDDVAAERKGEPEASTDGVVRFFRLRVAQQLPISRNKGHTALFVQEAVLRAVLQGVAVNLGKVRRAPLRELCPFGLVSEPRPGQ